MGSYQIMIMRLWKTGLCRAAVFAMLILVPWIGAFAVTETGKIPNPITATSFPCLVAAITGAVIQIAVPLAVVAIIIAGVRFILAAVSGNEGEITKAKSMLFWVVIGTAIVVGAFVIANAAVQFLGGKPTGELTC